jgi:hypothetical protein
MSAVTKPGPMAAMNLFDAFQVWDDLDLADRHAIATRITRDELANAPSAFDGVPCCYVAEFFVLRMFDRSDEASETAIRNASVGVEALGDAILADTLGNFLIDVSTLAKLASNRWVRTERLPARVAAYYIAAANLQVATDLQKFASPRPPVTIGFTVDISTEYADHVPESVLMAAYKAVARTNTENDQMAEHELQPSVFVFRDEGNWSIRARDVRKRAAEELCLAVEKNPSVHGAEMRPSEMPNGSAEDHRPIGFPVASMDYL